MTSSKSPESHTTSGESSSAAKQDHDSAKPRSRGLIRGGRKSSSSRSTSKRSPKVYRTFASLTEGDHKRLATEIDDGTYIVFDIESTGGNPEKNGITEISALRYRNGVVEDKFYSLVNPKCRIPPIVRKMTGIDREMVKDAPVIKDVMPGFIEFIRNDILVSHNTIGDLKFLVYFAKQACDFDLENFFLCTHLLTEKLISEAPDKSLKGLAAFFDFPIGAIHRADADAELTLLLFKEICQRLKATGRISIVDGIRLQGDFESGLRLGWAVNSKAVVNPPRGSGILSLYGRDKKVVFYTSSPSLKSELSRIMEYRKIPRRLLKVVLNTYDVGFESHPNLFDAMLGESKYSGDANLRYSAAEWHLRSPHVVLFKKVPDGIKVSVGEMEGGVSHAFGLINDRKACTNLIVEIGERFGLDATRNGATFSYSALPVLKSFFSGTLSEDLSRNRRMRYSLKSIFSRKYRQQARVLRDDLERLASLEVPRGMNSLLGMTGVVVGSSKRSGHWLVYPIVMSRPEPAISVKGDWRAWLAESDDGISLGVRLRDEAAKSLRKRVPGENLYSEDLVTDEESSKISAVFWVALGNRGRAHGCQFVDVGGL